MAKKRRYTLYQVEGPPKRRWKRILLWSSVSLVLVVLLLVAGSYVWFRAQVASANHRVTPELLQVLKEKPPTSLTTQAAAVGTVSNATTTTFKEPSPSAMNLLVIGSDRRSNDPSLGGRSDTLMIVHIDPDQGYLSILSLPRDLRVDIPGHGRGKLNSAFALGGPVLTIKTVEQTTGVDINHYLEIGFDAFTQIVDSLGGVYVDVDRRYFNVMGYYEPIDIQPGYQLLSGADALDYVRFRHDLNMDFGRMERQQRFIAALREQAMGWDLPFKLPSLISALFRNVATDLDANQILRLAKWGVGLNGDGIRGITLRGDTPTINGVAYVVATENQIAHAVDQLMYRNAPDEPSATDTTTPVRSGTATTVAANLTGITVDVTGAGGRAGEAGAAAAWLRSLGATVGTSVDGTGATQQQSTVQYPSGTLAEAKRVAAALKVSSVARTSRVDRITLLTGEDFVLPAAYALPAGPESVPNASTWKQWAGQTPFVVEAPTYLPAHYALVGRYPDSAATYPIKVSGGSRPAFRMMYEAASNPDQVFGITETTWLGAPAASKGLEVTHDGVVFTVVRNETAVQQVWWKRAGVLYFVSNTLSHWLDQEEMLKIAESMITMPAQ